ncbi:MAG: proton-conducting transporter membrane subunit [Lachnospiraceae bacterium]|nr:proton-conducting transporter membrane subunit [Lachnospiraceae bacterium]
MDTILNIQFGIDEISIVFCVLGVIVFLMAGIFSFEYMKHEGHHLRYTIFYLMAFAVYVALCFAGNLITYYLFFELLTLTTFPLVLHNGSKEAIMAGLKYLFYSLCGAYMSLFGLYFVYKHGETLSFTKGGVFTDAAFSGNGSLLLICAMLMIFGFGVKGGMFPMHAWLPTAHPVAPAPASAVLSAVIVKAGVLGILRSIYYIFGADRLRGTWVQSTWIIFTLITVFMGSMLAYREDVLKKRLAYSTVSQVSYILFGLATMTEDSYTGGLMHVLAHGFIKCGLFLVAGAIIYMTGKTKVSELRGIGKMMPLTIWCFTILSLGLIGIPPTGGFISKWYLATGALFSGIPVFNWLGPVILLVSALLTAGYLLPLSINGLLPGEDFDSKSVEKREPNGLMLFPIMVLTILTVLMGLFPQILDVLRGM